MINVHDVLSHKHFQCAEVVAGKEGLSHVIKWIHIMEIIEVKQLIKGNELVLTTGIVLKDNEQGFLTFVKQLISLKVAGLCVELGQYISKIPPSVIALADELNFPILVFTEEVPFVEITQDLHTTIIQQQYKALKQLEDYAQEINKYSLKVNEIDRILMYMQRYLYVNVVFEIKNQRTIFIPNKNYEVFETLKSQMNLNNIASCELNLFEQSYGKVYIYSESRELTDFDLLILDRTTVTLSQYVLRDLYIVEKSESEYRKFFEQWLEGQHSNEEVLQFLDEIDPKLKERGWMVMIHQLKREIMKKDLTYYKINVRKSLEKEGFHTFIVEQFKYLVVILSDLRDETTYKVRMKRAIDEILHQSKFEPLMAVGKYVEHFNQLGMSFHTAQDTIPIRWENINLSYFYDDLYVYHIIQVLQKNQLIMHLAKEKMDQIDRYDQKHNSDLMNTLKVYLSCNGLKKETAEKLFIVRQTLYHRLEKIEQILGADFMDAKNRLSLEIMLLMTEKDYTK